MLTGSAGQPRSPFSPRSPSPAGHRVIGRKRTAVCKVFIYREIHIEMIDLSSGGREECTTTALSRLATGEERRRSSCPSLWRARGGAGVANDKGEAHLRPRGLRGRKGFRKLSNKCAPSFYFHGPRRPRPAPPSAFPSAGWLAGGLYTLSARLVPVPLTRRFATDAGRRIPFESFGEKKITNL